MAASLSAPGYLNIRESSSLRAGSEVQLAPQLADEIQLISVVEASLACRKNNLIYCAAGKIQRKAHVALWS